MIEVLQHIGLVILYAVLFALNVCIFLGIPGGWVAYGAIVVYDAITGFSTLGWKWLVAMWASSAALSSQNSKTTSSQSHSWGRRPRTGDTRPRPDSGLRAAAAPP